jgi:hypothetical protein
MVSKMQWILRNSRACAHDAQRKDESRMAACLQLSEITVRVRRRLYFAFFHSCAVQIGCAVLSRET